MSDDFLSRWSRRKTSAKKSQSLVDEEHDHGSPTSVARVRTDASVPQRSDKQDASEGPNPEALAAQHPEHHDVETLGEGSDYKAFMKDGIPGELQSAALRKLWRTNPAYRVLDGLNDYDDDFRALHALAGAVKTVYQVGKGMPAPEKKPEDELADELADEPADAPANSGTEDLASDSQSKDDEVEERNESAPQDDREHSESDRSEVSEVAVPAEAPTKTPEAEPENGAPNAASADNKVTGFGEELHAIAQEMPVSLVSASDSHPLSDLRRRRRKAGAKIASATNIRQ